MTPWRAAMLSLAVALTLGASVPASAQTPLLDGPPECDSETGGAATPDDGLLRVATFNVLHTLEDSFRDPDNNALEFFAPPG